jgi:hypothetical protein
LFIEGAKVQGIGIGLPFLIESVGIQRNGIGLPWYENMRGGPRKLNRPSSQHAFDLCTSGICGDPKEWIRLSLVREYAGRSEEIESAFLSACIRLVHEWYLLPCIISCSSTRKRRGLTHVGACMGACLMNAALTWSHDCRWGCCNTCEFHCVLRRYN